MTFVFEPRALLLALLFSIFVIIMLFVMGARFIRRTNIIDIVNEARKSEPIRCRAQLVRLGRSRADDFGRNGGIPYALIFCPGYFTGMHPRDFSAIFYAPLFVGLYMVLLHTVVNGWSRKHKHYKNIISTSMMKFQGRQTVRNMLVMTVLLAGAYFAMFYSPMLGTSAMMGYSSRPTDYVFHYRMDQNMIGRAETEDAGARVRNNPKGLERGSMRYSGTGWPEAY